MGKSFPCGVCNKSVRVNQKGLKCIQCKKWAHISCSGVTDKMYNDRTEQFINWECRRCTMEHMPFFCEPYVRQIAIKDKREYMPNYSCKRDGFEITQLSKIGLNCVHLNVVSLIKNYDEINSMLCNNNIHIFSLNETTRVDWTIVFRIQKLELTIIN